jgi:RimJ/RimL family protein N-acetyltransferase
MRQDASMTVGDLGGGLRPDYPVHTERLRLRPHSMADLEDLVGFHGDPEVVRYIPWPVRDRAATETALRDKLDLGVLSAPGQWLVLAVELRESGRAIGEVLLKWVSREERTGELGYALARDQHGRGLATEAARAMLSLGFDQLGLRRIDAVCVAENAPSLRLLERLGFVRQQEQSVIFKGEQVTQVELALDAPTAVDLSRPAHP